MYATVMVNTIHVQRENNDLLPPVRMCVRGQVALKRVTEGT